MAGDVKNQPELDKPMIKDDKPEDKENGMTPTEVSINGDDSMEVETLDIRDAVILLLCWNQITCRLSSLSGLNTCVISNDVGLD